MKRFKGVMGDVGGVKLGPKRATLVTLALVLGFAACSSEPLADTSQGFETICYRGKVVQAERIGSGLYVDFDLEATEQEQWCPGDDPKAPLAAPGVTPQARRAPADPGSVWGTSTYGDFWPNGTVPYVISSDYTDVRRTAIVDAMNDWSRAAPGVSFRPKTASDTSWISVEVDSKDSSKCNSGYGRIDGARVVHLATRCIDNGSFSRHHELGHALGLQHEHTRADRDNFVVVSGGDNYQIDSGADMFQYDFDSIMHYSLSSHIALAPGVVVPPGVTVGQRTHLSSTDIASMNAIYPVATIHRTFFQNTGPQRLCRLTGREEDIVTVFATASTAPGLVGTSNANTNALTPGDYSVSCTAKSLFLSRDYNYPNSSYSEAINSSNSADTQTYSTAATVRVLNRGLIAVLI